MEDPAKRLALDTLLALLNSAQAELAALTSAGLDEWTKVLAHAADLRVSAFRYAIKAIEKELAA